MNILTKELSNLTIENKEQSQELIARKLIENKEKICAFYKYYLTDDAKQRIKHWYSVNSEKFKTKLNINELTEVLEGITAIYIGKQFLFNEPDRPPSALLKNVISLNQKSGSIVTIKLIDLLIEKTEKGLILAFEVDIGNNYHSDAHTAHLTSHLSSDSELKPVDAKFMMERYRKQQLNDELINFEIYPVNMSIDCILKGSPFSSRPNAKYLKKLKKTINES